MKYTVQDGEWKEMTGGKYSDVVDDTGFVICTCYYEEDAELICKLLNEQKEK